MYGRTKSIKYLVNTLFTDLDPPAAYVQEYPELGPENTQR